MRHSIKVLVVDDEEPFRAATRKVLDRLGFDTLLAANGREAVARMDQGPEVVILDIRMPGMDGIEVLKRIRGIAPDVPVIMLTGHGAEASAREALALGASDYLAKPCSMDLLAEKITDALRQAVHGGPPGERKVEDVMIPLAVYGAVTPDFTVEEAVSGLRASLAAGVAAGRVGERRPGSLLVLDSENRVVGVVAVTDLLDAVLPGYLSAPRPSTADTVHFSPMFWEGYFTRGIRELAQKRVADVMGPPPPAIGPDANLMEAAYLMRLNKSRRLAVTRDGHVAGVIREQDLLFEMERILRARRAE